MSYQSLVLDGLFVCRWQEPDPKDVEKYATELSVARAQQGRPLVALFIMPPDSAAPDDTFRKAQAERLPEIMSNVSFAVAVFEGTGFFASLRRSALVGILLLAPKKYPIYVRSSAEEALLTNPPGPLGFNPQMALLELRRRNFCS